MVLSLQRERRIEGSSRNHISFSFAVGPSCVFTFSLAFCNESFNEVILEP